MNEPDFTLVGTITTAAGEVLTLDVWDAWSCPQEPRLAALAQILAPVVGDPMVNAGLAALRKMAEVLPGSVVAIVPRPALPEGTVY
jgi:hypothetical protein